MIAYLTRLEAKRQFDGDHYNYKPLMDYLVDHRPATSTAEWGVMFADEKLMQSLKTRQDVLDEQQERLELFMKGKL